MENEHQFSESPQPSAPPTYMVKKKLPQYIITFNGEYIEKETRPPPVNYNLQKLNEGKVYFAVDINYWMTGMEMLSIYNWCSKVSSEKAHIYRVQELPS